MTRATAIRAAPLAAALLVAGCQAGDPPEVASCAAFTRQLFSDPASFRATSSIVEDEAMTKAAYLKRAGYGPLRREPMKLFGALLDAAISEAKSTGGAGRLGVRSVVIRYVGGGSSEVVPPAGNVCEFRTIDGLVESDDMLALRVQRATANRMLVALAPMVGRHAELAFHPRTPCCLVP